MKQFYFFRCLFLVVVVLCCNMPLYAADLMTEQVVVNLESAGTLPDKISATDKNRITNLKVTGDINGTDFLFIREMGGLDITGDITRGNLKALDISEASVVDGGDSYVTSKNKINSEIFSSLKLESVSLPSEVTEIGWAAFAKCAKLSSIKFPEELLTIDKSAFQGCSTLVSVNLPNKLEAIWASAFADCSSLKQITLPNSLTTIGAGAFANDVALVSLDIPGGIKVLESDVFNH